MYQKYNTEALVLANSAIGEDDRMVALLTRDFGLVWARAAGVRKESSKMRYGTQRYSHSFVSLVRGKRGWRLAGAAAVRTAGASPERMAAFARAAELTVRLVAGEEENGYLFATLAHAHEALMCESEVPSATVEIVCVARILFALGYLSPEALECTLFTHTAFGADHVREAEAQRDALLATVNRAMAETHL